MLSLINSFMITDDDDDNDGDVDDDDCYYYYCFYFHYNHNYNKFSNLIEENYLSLISALIGLCNRTVRARLQGFFFFTAGN